MKRIALFRRLACILAGILLLTACGPSAAGTAQMPPAPTATLIPTSTPGMAAATSPADESQLAQESLVAFFYLLNQGDYTQADMLYGGPYDALAASNPALSPDDHIGLLQNGCEINGFQCLQVRSTVLQAQTGPDEFQFSVEFSQENGDLFVRGPCCGASETDMPPQSQFSFGVKKVNGQYLVMDLPVYVP